MLLKHLRKEAFLWDLLSRCGEFFDAIRIAPEDMIPCPRRRTAKTNGKSEIFFAHGALTRKF